MGISKPIDDVIFDFKHIIRGGKHETDEYCRFTIHVLQSIAENKK